MKKLTSTTTMGLSLAIGLAIGLASGLASAPAHAADGDKSPQQGRMAMCNNNAVGKKGDERRAFMKECLGAKKDGQQSKMKTCNADAGTKNLKGDERRGFMKECLSKKA
jgi:psiF repeat